MYKQEVDHTSEKVPAGAEISSLCWTLESWGSHTIRARGCHMRGTGCFDTFLFVYWEGWKWPSFFWFQLWTPFIMYLSILTAKTCAAQKKNHTILKDFHYSSQCLWWPPPPEAATRGKCVGISVLVSGRAPSCPQWQHCIPCPRISNCFCNPHWPHFPTLKQNAWSLPPSPLGMLSTCERGVLLGSGGRSRARQESLQSSPTVFNSKGANPIWFWRKAENPCRKKICCLCWGTMLQLETRDLPSITTTCWSNLACGFALSRHFSISCYLPSGWAKDQSSTSSFNSWYLFPLTGAKLASTFEEEVTSSLMAQQQEMPKRIYIDRRNANVLSRPFISHGKISRRSQLSSTLVKKSPKEADIGEQELCLMVTSGECVSNTFSSSS